MIQGIALLLGFQLLGETASFLTGGHVPGPVIGLAFLAAFLLALRRRKPDSAIETLTGKAADGLLANLGVLFVPAGVGVIQHLDVMRSLGLPILVVILVSTVVTLIVTVWTFVAVKKLEKRRRRA